MNTRKFLNLTIPSTCSSQNLITLTSLSCFLFLLILRPLFPPSWQSQFWWSSTSPSSFSSIFPINLPTSLYTEQLWQLHCSVSDSVRRKQGRPWDSVCKVYSGAEWRPGFTHHSFAGSPRTTPSPARSIHGKCPVHYLLRHTFTICFLCLDTQIISIVLQLPTVFSIVTCCAGFNLGAIGYTI